MGPAAVTASDESSDGLILHISWSTLAVPAAVVVAAGVVARCVFAGRAFSPNSAGHGQQRIVRPHRGKQVGGYEPSFSIYLGNALDDHQLRTDRRFTASTAAPENHRQTVLI